MLEYYYKFRESNDGKLHAIMDQSSGSYRTSLYSDLTLYVRKDGDDANEGFTDSADGAFLTINAAIRSLLRFDAQGYAIKIVVHEGEYKEDVVFNPYLNSIGYKSLTLMGYEGEIVNVMHASSNIAITVSGAKSINIESINITINKEINQANICIIVLLNGSATCKNCTFIATVRMTRAVHVINGSYLQLTGNNTLNLSNGHFMLTAYNGGNLVLSGTIHNQNAVASDSYVCAQGGYIASSAIFTGSVTGKRYYACENGVITISGSGSKYFPGTVAGTTYTGGVYVEYN